MAQLEDLKRGARLAGLVAGEAAEIEAPGPRLRKRARVAIVRSIAQSHGDKLDVAPGEARV